MLTSWPARLVVAFVVALLPARHCEAHDWPGSIIAANGQPAAATDERRVNAIREALLRLPYYGVFDFLTFTYEKGAVTLGGFAYHGTLASDAERAVKRVAGVDEVRVNITQVPVSSFDDDIRWRVFYAIYTNTFLERYNPGGGFGWGHLHPLRRNAFGVFPAFPGAQPVGNYPIHIVVQGGASGCLASSTPTPTRRSPPSPPAA